MIAEFKVSGIHCEACVSLIKMGVGELEGVSEISADQGKSLVKVSFDENTTSPKDIIKKIEAEGYKVVQYNKKSR